jgi:ABC-type sugar transport system substrate-binding protein
MLLLVACAEDPVAEVEPADTTDEGEVGDTEDAGGTEDAGDASEASGDVVQIGYAPSELDETDFFGQFQLGLEEGLQELGVEYELTARAPDDATGHSQQFDFVEDLITLGVDLIIIAPTEFEAQVSSYQAVNEAGIPLFITNFSRPEEEQDFEVVQYSGYSHLEGGEANAEYLVDALDPETDQIAILRGVPGDVDDQRVNPVVEAFEEAGFTIVAEEVANFDRDIAFEATQRLLGAYPDTTFIYAANSGMAAGALAALESSGLTPNEDVRVWGYGGTVEELEAILDGRQFGTVFRDPTEMGRNMATAIQQLLEGNEDEIDPDFRATMQILDSCEDIVERVPDVTFGGNPPTMDDC